MIKRFVPDALFEEVRTLVESFSCDLVRVRKGQVSKTFLVHVVVTRLQPVDLQCLESLHQILLPHLEAYLQRHDIALNLSTPGLEARLETDWELRLFEGRRVLLMSQSDNDWKKARLGELDDEGVLFFFLEKNSETHLDFSEIKKIKLDPVGK